MLLSDHPLVDLQRSDVDWDAKESEEAIYKIKSKSYVDYRTKQSRPDHWLTWVRYYPERPAFDEFNYLKRSGYQPVSVDDKLYWPEGLAPDENGYYVIGDLILMQRPLLQYVREQLKQEALTNKGGQAQLDKIESDIEAEGGSVEGVDSFFDRKRPTPEPRRVY